MRFGLFSILAMGVLREAVPAGGGGGGPPAPAPAPAPAPGQPFAVFESQAALEDRLARAGRATLREVTGLENPEEVKQRLNRLKELEAAEEQRRQAELTETQRLQADVDKERQRAEAAERRLQESQFQTQVTQECARLGIKNVKYALFEVQTARGALPEAERASLDPARHLEGLLAKPEYKGAFGIESAPTVIPVPVNTSPAPGAPPPAPPQPGAPPPAVDAMTMSGPEFKAHLERLQVTPM